MPIVTQYFRASGGHTVAEELKTRWIYCNHCGSQTRHLCIALKEYRYSEENAPDEWGTYRLWTCAGCDACTMEKEYSSDAMCKDDGEMYSESEFYPKRGHAIRPYKIFVLLPPKLTSLYMQIISAHNERLNLVCAAGLRALVEGVCADQNAVGRKLEQKINGMGQVLPSSIVKNLHSFRFIGNNAVHDLEPPSDVEVILAIDVIEDLLNYFYELDYKARMLSEVRAALSVKRSKNPDTI
jgi:hypothetical protein